MTSTISAVIILLFVALQLTSAYRSNYNNYGRNYNYATPYNNGYNGYNNYYNNYNYNRYPQYNNAYGNYNAYNAYNPYRTYATNGYGNYNYYNNGYNGYNNGYNGYNNGANNYHYSTPFGGTTAGGTYVGNSLGRIWLTCNGNGCPARG